jgi:DNA-binding MarR family transcriptional regulator
MKQSIEILPLTTLEKITLNSLVEQLYAEAGFSDVDVNDISNDINVSTSIIRGALGSLSKKGYIFVETQNGYDIIYLAYKHWYLVSEYWAEESKIYLV